VWFRHDIARRFNSSLRDERDIHSRLMLAYPEVPRWWYAILGLGAFVMLVIAIEIFPTGMPVWAAILAILTAFVLALPLGMLQAITNQTIALEVMHEMVAGYIMPGHPIANMIYKAVAYIGASQAVSFSGDLKLGHYMKIPPRMMFACQCVAAIISCFVVTGVQDWMFANIPDFCTENQTSGFVCPSTNTFATASLIWGGVGPRRLFTPGSM
jgi:OPT family oligopeptide transporter